MNYPLLLGQDKELATRLEYFFDSNRIEQVARSTKFIERSSTRLTGLMFLKLNMFNFSQEKERSLSDQCDYLEEAFDLKLKKQSLDERYNTYSVAFMKQCYEKLLSEVMQPYLKQVEEDKEDKESVFNGIELVDATAFDLSPTLKIFYKGGGNVESTVKIHHRYELQKGETISLKVVSGHESDACFLKDLDQVLIKKRLYIKDLGYYKIDHLQNIDHAGGYFLSRNKSSTNCYIKNKAGLYEEVFMKDLVPTYGEDKEIAEIYIGKKKLKVRMIIQSVPKECIEKRKKKVIRKNKTGGCKSMLRATLLLCSFNVYITNAECSILSSEKVRLLYALRWQIELIFKIWKTVFDIDKSKQMNIFRFECHLYGRLMAILLSEKIQNLYRDFIWEEQELEISEYKCAKILKKNA